MRGFSYTDCDGCCLARARNLAVNTERRRMAIEAVQRRECKVSGVLGWSRIKNGLIVAASTLDEGGTIRVSGCQG